MKQNIMMEELEMCLREQGLNEYSWGITLQEYFLFCKIINVDGGR